MMKANNDTVANNKQDVFPTDQTVSLPVLQKPDSIDQQKRFTSALKSECTPLEISKETRSGTFSGYHGKYLTTLEKCNCRDFLTRNKPCKHMYRLAIELGLISEKAESDLSRVKYSTDKKTALIRAIELLEAKPELFSITDAILCCHKTRRDYVCYNTTEVQYLIDNKMVYVLKDPVKALTALGQKKTIDAINKTGLSFPPELKLKKQQYAWCLENAEEVCDLIIPNHGILKIDEYLGAAFTKIHSYVSRRGKASKYYPDYTYDYYGLLDGLDRDVAELLCRYDEDFKKTYDANPHFPEDKTTIIISAPLQSDSKEPLPDDTSSKSTKLQNIKFIVTGKFSRSLLDIAELIIDNGGTVIASLDEDLSYVVMGEKPNPKFEKADELGVKIITEGQLMDMIAE